MFLIDGAEIRGNRLSTIFRIPMAIILAREIMKTIPSLQIVSDSDKTNCK